MEPVDINGRNNSNIPRTNQIAPAQIDRAASINKPSSEGNLVSKLFKLLFFIHLSASAVLVAFLSIRGFFTKSRSPTFRPIGYFAPILSSVALSAVIALLWLLCTLHRPARVLKHSLWISPLFTCFMGIHLLVQATAASFVCGALALALALAQSLYAFWVSARLPYAYRVLSVSVSNVQYSVSVAKYVTYAICTSTGYSLLWTIGVGGVAASDAKKFASIYLLLLLLSLSWTMQVIKNTVHVAISHIAHARLARGGEVSARDAFRGARGRAFGDVCVGSALAPAVGFVRGTARATGLLAGGAEEFMFSCAGCYRGVADQLAAHANRWGFVHVGAYRKGFLRASEDTWGMFRRRGMERLIDSDLAGSFCFLCGTAGGAISALSGGSWVLAVDGTVATEVTVYTFIIGYFMMRIAMAWPHSCISAYHVAYAEDPQNPMVGSIITDRLRELEPSPC